MNIENSTSGGSANQAGLNYQNRVAAWCCTHILAEKAVASPWEIGSNTTIEFIRCETEQPVDDILLGTSSNGLIFLNVKHSIKFSKKRDSAFGSVVSQFVSQFTSYRGEKAGDQPWMRELDASTDRLILVTTHSGCSGSLRNSLRKILSKIRTVTSKENFLFLVEHSSNAEQDTLTTLRHHISQTWEEVVGSSIQFHEELELLKLIRIEILDVDESDSSEKEAQNILRTSILKLPSDSLSGWNLLIQHCANLASNRGSASRESLQELFLKSGLKLSIVKGYEGDVEKLINHSHQTLELLGDYSSIKVGETLVKIRRPSTEILVEVSKNYSIVVVGEPGAGKSGALFDVAEALRSESKDVVVFAVDGLQATSLNNLRDELGLEHELTNVLENWPGDEPGFLIIDALDAARSEAAAQTFYELISLVFKYAPRWNVIASIRHFDLRNHSKLRGLFAGQPVEDYGEREFYNVRHFNIRRLGREELDQIESQSPQLYELIQKGSPQFRKLLEIPFNLRLAGQLVGAGVSREKLIPIKNQIALLDLFWEERVVGFDNSGDARQAMLLQVVQNMVRGKNLRADKLQIVTASSGHILHRLLSSGILSEDKPGSNLIAFSHHMLFDYAVARLLFRGEVSKVAELLETDKDLILTVRPSITFHFQHIWISDSEGFWETYFEVVASPNIPKVAKLIGATVAIQFDYDQNNFQPFIRALLKSNKEQKEIAEQVFRQLTGAMVVELERSNVKFIGTAAEPWCQFLEECTREMPEARVYSVRPILWVFCKEEALLTSNQKQSLGLIARRILDIALGWKNRDSLLINAGIETVCRTFESDEEKSKEVLCRLLTPEHVMAYGHEELFRFGEEVERLIPIAPDFVEKVFLAAFTNCDLSNDQTDITGSRILPLLSTRRQNFDMARYSLVRHFSKLLKLAPANAIRVLVDAIHIFIVERYRDDIWFHNSLESTREPEFEREFFDFNGSTVYIEQDNSHIWNEGPRGNGEYAPEMVSHFFNFLDEISSDEDISSDLRGNVIKFLFSKTGKAIFWRRLLRAGKNAPNTLGNDIRSLAWSVPILTFLDTTIEAGDYIRANFQNFSREEKIKVEEAIFEIFTRAPKHLRRGMKRTRDRLLGYIEPEEIVTEKARRVVNKLLRKNAVPANNPLFSISSFMGGTVTDEDILQESGVQLDEDKNRRIYDIWQQLKDFTKSFFNEIPKTENALAIIPKLRELLNALQQEGHEIPEAHRNMAWQYLADACADIAKLKDWELDVENTNFIVQALLQCARYPDPSFLEIENDFFDRTPAWGPAARIEAAQGIGDLLIHAECVNDDLLSAIEELGSRDPAPQVRFQIATRIDHLYYTAPEVMWRLIDYYAKNEIRAGVLQFFIPGALTNLAPYHSDQVIKYSQEIFYRFTGDAEAAIEIRKKCSSIFLGLCVTQDHLEAKEMTLKLVNDPILFNHELHQIVFNLRQYLNFGLDGESNDRKNKARIVSFSLIEMILDKTLMSLRKIDEGNKNITFNELSESDISALKGLASLANSVCNQIYFASGAYNERESRKAEVSEDLEHRDIFFEDARNSLNLLSQFGYANLTHHLLETLEFFAPYNPKIVFKSIAAVVEKGKEGGYQYEQLAADLIVKLVGRFIAEFRLIFRQDQECRDALINILDVFVDAGWVNAKQLTYRMEEIFR